MKSEDQFKDRLQKAMDDDGCNASQLAQRLGIQASTISRWLKGASSPQPNSLIALAQQLRVNARWLSTGEGKINEAIDESDRNPPKEYARSSVAKAIASIAASVANDRSLFDEGSESYEILDAITLQLSALAQALRDGTGS